MKPKPKHWQAPYSEQFMDRSVVDAYEFRPSYPTELTDFLVQLIPRDGPPTVLDAGCGTGFLARPLSGLVDRVDAVDISDYGIARGQMLEGGQRPNLNWIVGRIEDVTLNPPYGLVVAGQSLHWMDWRIVMPRFASLLVPGGVLAICGIHVTQPVWQSELIEIITRYSTNHDYRSANLVEELESRGLFSRTGDWTTAAVLYRQGLDDYVESWHARNGLSKDRMGEGAAAQFDKELQELLTRYGSDNEVSLQIAGHVTWGIPIKPENVGKHYQLQPRHGNMRLNMSNLSEQTEYSWWQTGVVYQIYPRSFKDTTGNGVGDLRGIIEELDYLSDGTDDSLGVDAIWISPFYPSPMADFGYDVADYCDVDPLFGNLATFDELLEEAHKREIKIIIDWVPNHTSDQHPWFIESRSSREHPKRDWYIWRDPKHDGSPPNNWGSFFGGPAWTFDEATGQYYMHQFVPEQPELNWRNPEVKRAMFDTLRFWLDRGVDGFRMDVIGLIIKDEALRDNPPNPSASPNLPENDLFGRLLQVYNLDQDEVHDVLKEIRQVLDEYEDRVGIGELWGPLDRWVKYYGERGEELHMPFNFRLMGLPFEANVMRQSVDEMEAALPPFAWPNYVLGNHDRPRLASVCGGQAQARLGAMMLLTLRGTPTLYYGDELGMTNGVIPPHKIQDPQGVNLGAERTRDVCRTPMQWNSEENAGFSEDEPWLPVSADYRERNVAVLSAEPDSILSFYRSLLRCRHSSAPLRFGKYQALDLGVNIFAYYRQAGDQRCLVLLNFSDVAHQLTVPGEDAGELALSTHGGRTGKLALKGLTLEPLEGMIVEL